MVHPELTANSLGSGSSLPAPEIPYQNGNALQSCSKNLSTDDEDRHFGSADWLGGTVSPFLEEKLNPQDTTPPISLFEGLENGSISLKDALLSLLPDAKEPAGGFTDEFCISMIDHLFNTLPVRSKLPQYNTFDDAVDLFRKSKNILILTGAGVSVSCGIPDFRSKNGIYARLHVDFPDLPDPTAMFDIRYFSHNPQPFYNFAKEIFMGQFEPSLSHKFIKQLEVNGQLQRNYTQNIDTLEKQAGIQRVIECHGSFSKATCRQCQAKFDGDFIKDDVMAQRVALCPHCGDGVIKPDITFFGEDLDQEFHRAMVEDKNKVDLVVVIGSSLKVGPVNSVPHAVNKNVPQILINREPLKDYQADICLLGNCDDIIREICFALGGNFQEMVFDHGQLSGILQKDISDETMKKKDPEYRNLQKPRIKLDHQEFLKVALSGETESESPDDSERSDEDSQPEAKRQKLEKMEPAFKRRFIRIQKRFPVGGYYFQTDFATAIFFGSYVYYDTEKQALTATPTMRYGFPCYMNRDDPFFTQDEDEEEEDSSARGGSVPPDYGDRESESPPARALSCEPSFDVESLIPSVTILKSLEKEEEDDDDDSRERNFDHYELASSGGESPKHEFSPDDDDL